MKKLLNQLTHLIIISTICFYSLTSFADNGEALHQARCIECHALMTGGDGTLIYQREDRISGSFKALHLRVEHCQQGSNTAWSNDELHLVIDYLNETFYQF